MPKAYAVDLRWRVVWLYLAQNRSSSEISSLLLLSERSVRRYISLFYRTGDVEPVSQRHGPQKLLGDFGQLTLLHIILSNPGIYLSEIKEQLTRLVGVEVSVSTICRTLKFMGCSRQAMCRVALQQSDQLRAKFMAQISVYDPSMFIWLDETGCDRRHMIRKYGYSIRGIPLCDQRLLLRGKRYNAIPILSLEGIHDLYLAEGSMNGDRFAQFVRDCLVPHLLPFNGVNPRSVVIMDNASIHHVDEVTDLIETQAGAKLCFLPPYSPDLMPVEGIFSQAKSIMKSCDRLFEVFSSPRSLIAMVFGMITKEDCHGHISHCGYV